MTANEIRQMLAANGINTQALSSGKMETSAFHAIATWEIALQLAEMNEKREKLIQAIPRGDAFITGGHRD
jgi:hypothetical protein